LIQGDQSSLGQFWQLLATEHTPILEPIANDTESVLVTFVWHGDVETKGVSVIGREMTRLLETDLWFTTLSMPKIPVFYSFFPRLAGGTEQRCADPLNPHRFFVPPEVVAAIPADLQAAHSQWRNMSMLLFGENPAARWTEEKPSVPKGRVEMFRMEEKGHERARRLWVYTPPNYDREEGGPYWLLICFDGVSYLSEIPVPTILNNLLAGNTIWPTVAVLVDNGGARESAEDLDNHAVFADFLAKDLMTWVHKRWRISTDPSHTIVCGYSRGGLAAAYAAWKHPEVFGNVLAQSGAFWRGNEGGIVDPEWLTKQFKDSPRQRLRFYVEAGSEETGKTPAGPIFIEANRRFCQTLKAKGYDVDYVEVSGGRHDPINWRFQVAQGIRFLAAKMP
jgi:enterochelin esterase family protein